jgi:hypothetical protein
MQTMRFLLLTVLAALPIGCAPPQTPTTMIDPRADRTAIGLGLDSRDFEGAAAKSVQDMLESHAVDKPGGGRYVMVVSRVVIAHPAPASASPGRLADITNRTVSSTEARLAFAVLTTERKAA